MSSALCDLCKGSNPPWLGRVSFVWAFLGINSQHFSYFSLRSSGHLPRRSIPGFVLLSYLALPVHGIAVFCFNSFVVELLERLSRLEFWDMKQKKQIIKTQSTDTTYFEWCPDGQHLLTATTAPRLRVGNGFRIWHYSGTLMLQHFTKDHAELWQATWQPRPADQILPFNITTKAVASTVQEQPKIQGVAYRPPQMRDSGAKPAALKPLYELESASNAQKSQSDKAPSKNKKKREAQKAKAAREGVSKPEDSASSTTAASDSASSLGSSVGAVSTGDPEKDKKLRNLKKKLQQIEKLKEQQAAGKEMEKNQVEKIKTLDSLLQEIEDLELG